MSSVIIFLKRSALLRQANLFLPGLSVLDFGTLQITKRIRPKSKFNLKALVGDNLKDVLKLIIILKKTTSLKKYFVYIIHKNYADSMDMVWRLTLFMEILW